MQGVKVELRQLVGRTSTAAGVFEVAHATDMVMVYTEAMPEGRHYGYISHDPRGKFCALPHYVTDFPVGVRQMIEAELSRLKGRDVGYVQAPAVKQPEPARRADPVADDDE
jgi:hypothetical protein